MTLPSSTVQKEVIDKKPEDSFETESDKKLKERQAKEFLRRVIEILELQGNKLKHSIGLLGVERGIVIPKENNILKNKETNLRLFVQCKTGNSEVDETEIKEFIENVRNARGNDECDRDLMISKSGFMKSTYELRSKYRFIEFKT